MSHATTNSSTNGVSNTNGVSHSIRVFNPNSTAYNPTIDTLQESSAGTIVARVAPRRTNDNRWMEPDTRPEMMNNYEYYTVRGVDVNSMTDTTRCLCVRLPGIQKCVSGKCYLITFDANTSLARAPRDRETEAPDTATVAPGTVTVVRDTRGTQVFPEGRRAVSAEALQNRDYQLYMVNFMGCQWFVGQIPVPQGISADSRPAEDDDGEAVRGPLQVTNDGSRPTTNGVNHDEVGSPSSDEGLFIAGQR